MKKAELFCRRKLNSSDNIIDISPDNHLMLMPEIKNSAADYSFISGFAYLLQ